MLGNFGFGLRMIESENAFEIVRRAKKVKRTFRERFFSKLYGRYYVPFRKQKLVFVEEKKPAMYLLKGTNTFLYHPALKDSLIAAINSKNLS